MVGSVRTRPEPVERRGQAPGETAADAAVGELDGVAVGTAHQRGVDVDRADVVDEDGDRPIGLGEHRIDDGRLPGTEVAAEQGHRHTAAVPRCDHLGCVISLVERHRSRR